MHDFITSYMVSQEIEHQARTRRKDLLDPDSLYQYEIWDSIGARPSIKDRFLALIQRIRRQQPTLDPGTATRENPVSCYTQHVPQG